MEPPSNATRRSGHGAGPAAGGPAGPIGLTFLWAFFDKLFGLGYSGQGVGQRRIADQGFLGNVDVGPLQPVFRSWAGISVADWLFMIGMFGIGLALVLGIGMRVAAVSGAVLLLARWVASWPMAAVDAAGKPTASNNLVVDGHLVYAVLVVALAVCAAGDTWGFGRPWALLTLVSRNPWLH